MSEESPHGSVERLVGRLRVAATKLDRSDEWENLRDDLHHAAAEIDRLRAAVTALRAELDNIASADPSKWDADVRDQFRQWVQSRARHALRLADEALGTEADRG